MNNIIHKQLFEQHYKSLCHFAWKLCGDVTEAEDLVQDAFISYFSNEPLVSTHEKAIKNFLYTSVKFAYLNSKRREKVVEKYWISSPFNECSHESLELNIIHSEVIAEVSKIMDSLPMGSQIVFKMGYFEGLSNQEISQELNISVNTVKTQKQRALKTIMKKLNPEFLPLILFFYSMPR